MTFGPQITKIEYPDQYMTLFGLIKKPAEEKSITISFGSQNEIKPGSKAFPFLLPEVTITGTKPNTVFSQNTNQVNNIDGGKTNVSNELTTNNAVTGTDSRGIDNSTNSNPAVNGSSKKSGESIDERLTRYYTKYKSATPEEKEAFLDRYITGHYATLKDKSREEQIKIQLADFKKLLSNTKEGDSYEMLAKKINILEKENQVLAAKSATVEQEDSNLRKRGEIGVAKTIHNCDKDNQIALTHIIVDSKNEEAINIGASHTSELDKNNQVGAVDIYKTADISKEGKIELAKTIVDQYSKFDIANQVDIHSIMSDAKFWDEKSIVYAASNIYNLDKTNQAQAIQITADTKNEAAIKAAQTNLVKCDESVRQTGQETLVKAEEEIQETKISSSDKIKEVIKNPNAENAKKVVETATDAMKINALQTLSGSDLKNFIKILLEENPSMAVFSKAMELAGRLSEQDRKEVMDLMKNSSMANLINPQTLDYASQNALIDFKAEQGKLGQIKSDGLSAALKVKYFKLIENTKQGKQVG